MTTLPRQQHANFIRQMRDRVTNRVMSIRAVRSVIKDPAARSQRETIANVSPVTLDPSARQQRMRTMAGIRNLFAKATAEQGGLRKGDELLIAKAIDVLSAADPTLTTRNPIVAMEAVSRSEDDPFVQQRAYQLAEAADAYITSNTGKSRNSWTIQRFNDELTVARGAEDSVVAR